MNKVLFRTGGIPTFDRDNFLLPFDKVFDALFESQFPEIVKTIGIKPFQGSAYPRVNIYECDDKLQIVAEIPGLEKSQLDIEVNDRILTIKGDKHHSTKSVDKSAKLIRRELKQSSFQRAFELGDQLDGDNVTAEFKNGILTVNIPKLDPQKPSVNKVDIL